MSVRVRSGRCVTFAVVAAALVLSGRAAVQEGFDYTAGTLDGTQSGGIGFAAGNWGSGASAYASIVTGLRYPGLDTAGRSAIRSSGSGSNARTTAASYGGSSFYLSMLINANSIETTRFGFELRNGADGPLFGRVNGGWGMFSGPNGKMGITHSDGSYQTWRGVTSAADTATHLIVVKIDYAAQAIKLFVDPVINGAEPAPTATLTTGGKWTINLNSQTWNGIRLFHEKANQTADELRIGTTWASVVPVRVSSGDVPAHYFIAPDGHATNTGAFASPFATLEQARDALNLALQEGDLPAGGVTLWLRGGRYARTNSFELTSGESGTASNPIVYRAWPGETVRIHGARSLAPAWFTVVTNGAPIWPRLDPAARGHVMQVDLAAHGITDFSTLRRRGFGSSSTLAALELIVDGAPQPLARWPDPDQHDSNPSFTNLELVISGNPIPDTTGIYEADGLSDGVNRYRRRGLMNGKQYHLYRHAWTLANSSFTVWFLATQTAGYPGNADPWWYRYSPTLGDLLEAPQSLSRGSPHFRLDGQIMHGWAAVATAVSSNTFTYSGDRPQRWTAAEEVWLHGFWMHLWADDHLRASGINTNSRTVTLASEPVFGITAGAPFYAENLLEEITRPGEWYLNRASGMLYFWPPTELAGHEIDVSMLEVPLVRLTGVRHVTWQDLTFETTRGDLLAIVGGDHNRVLHCTLRNAGNYAAKISGTRNGIIGCEISDPGDGGILLSGGDRASLTGAGNTVRNCTIHGFGRWSWMSTPGVRVDAGGVGHAVTHNRFYDAPHTAILIGGGNYNLVEFNDIRDVCQWTSDAGAIYTGRDFGAHGTLIGRNFVHDIAGRFDTGFGTHGIYLDDGIAGIELVGNICHHISGLGIVHGGGRDVLMHNNVLARNGTGLGADARVIGWMMRNGNSSNAWAALQALPYRGAIWSNAFPQLYAMPTNWAAVVSEGWLAPRGTVFSRNIGASNTVWVGNSDNATSFYREVEDNLPDGAPLFVDEANLDLTLQSDSPAFAIPGFLAISFQQIGPESDALKELAAWDFPTATDREGFSADMLARPSLLTVNGMTARAAPGHPTWSVEVPLAELNAADEASAVAAGDAFEFTLAPTKQGRFSLAAFTFSHRQNGTAAATLFLRSSADGYAATLGSVTVSGSNVWDETVFTLSGVAALQGRTTPVTLRLYACKPTGGAGTPRLSIDNLRLTGRSQSRPSAIPNMAGEAPDGATTNAE